MCLLPLAPFGAGSCLQIPTGLGGSLGSVLPGFDEIRVIESILGKPLQGAVGASGLGGSCNGISEMAILGLAAVLPKCRTEAGPECCSMLSILTSF